MFRTLLRLLLCPVLAMSLSSCLVRRHVIASPAALDKRPLLTATKDELIRKVHDISDPIQSFTAKVSMAASVGGVYGGQVTDYATIDGFTLLQRPDTIRVLGQDPVLHTTLFDMVSTGEDFKLSIPGKSRFVAGKNGALPSSKNKLENLRPTMFLNALMIAPPDPAELTMLEEDVDENHAFYILLIVRREQNDLRLARSVYFDHRTLEIVRQKTFDEPGAILGDATYSGWKQFNGVLFPSTIEMRRPQDGFELTLTINDLKVNAGDLTPEKFALEPPEGTKVEQLKD
jgi:hypothetical protein